MAATKRLPAGAGRIFDVILQVLKYDIFCDRTIGGRKIPPAPKSLPPIALLENRKFLLNEERRTPFNLSHEVTDRKFGRDRYEHVHMVSGQNAIDNVDAIFCTNPPDDFPHPLANIAFENFVTVLCRPDDVITMIKNTMFAFFVLHDHTLQKNEPQALRAVHFSGEYGHS